MFEFDRPQSFVFLFLGESGARGQSDNSELPAQYLEPDSNIQMVRNDNFKIEPLHIGENNNLTHDSRKEWHGWEHGLQLYLRSITGNSRCYLCKVGVGGSRIDQWDSNDPNWDERFLGRVGAMKQATAQVNATWVIFFSLGLNDANQGTDPNTWRPKVQNLIARARAEIPQDIVHVMNPLFSSGMITNTPNQFFNDQMEAIAQSDPYLHLIPSDGLPVKQDRLHWATAANAELTRRFLVKFQQVR